MTQTQNGSIRTQGRKANLRPPGTVSGDGGQAAEQAGGMVSVDEDPVENLPNVTRN